MPRHRVQEPSPQRRSVYIFAIAFTAAIGGFLFGYDLSLIGAANMYLKEQFQMLPETKGRSLEKIAGSWQRH